MLFQKTNQEMEHRGRPTTLCGPYPWTTYPRLCPPGRCRRSPSRARNLPKNSYANRHMAPNRNGRFRLILLGACGDPWRGDTFVRIEDDTENVVYRKRANYEGPITFTGLRTPPRGWHMLHIKTTLHTPVSRFIRVKADECEKVKARLLVRYRKADKHGHRFPFTRSWRRTSSATS